jgi:hypothetical protein
MPLAFSTGQAKKLLQRAAALFPCGDDTISLLLE